MTLTKCKLTYAGLSLLPGIAISAGIMASEPGLLDDRRYPDLRTPTGPEWRFVSDRVMGGVSTGELVPAERLGRACLCLSGKVRTDNNGGFIQMALPLTKTSVANIDEFEGVTLMVTGNGEGYNLHLKTSDLWLPWQSYRARIAAGSEWQRIQIPFSAFEAHRTNKSLRISRLNQLGLVAIGREFTADLCLAEIGFYPKDD